MELLINMVMTQLSTAQCVMRGDTNNRKDSNRKKYMGTPYKRGYDSIICASIDYERRC